jgi:LPS-assembly protein
LTPLSTECYNHAVISFQRTAFFLLLGLSIGSPLLAQEGNLKIPGKKRVEIQADHLDYLREEDRFVADGSVVVTRGPFRLTADHAEMDNARNHLTARGRVRLEEGGNIVTAETAEYDLNTGEGTLEHGTLFVAEQQLSVSAERIEKLPEDRYRVSEAVLTTCRFEPGEAPLWRFRARRADVRVEHYLTARDVTFRIKDVPVFYTPYFLMPVKTTRQTGLLVPSLGYNTREGFKLKEDLFWAIARNQDATFSADYRSSRGVGGEVEYRYKTSRDSWGEIRTRYFHDRTDDVERWRGEAKNQLTLRPDLVAKLDLRLVNEPTQFRALSDVTARRIQNALESNFILSRRWDNHFLYLSARYTRDLAEPPATSRIPVQRYPEIGYRLLPHPLFGTPFYAELEATGTNFYVADEDPASGLVRAVRLDAFPRLGARINLLGLVLTPRVGWRGTWYSDGATGNSSAERSLMVADAGAILRLFNNWRDGPGGRLTHYVESSAYYEYVPKVDQSDLPRFDAVDQILPKNVVTYSMTNRWVGLRRRDGDQAVTRREWIVVRVTQSYDIREKRRNEPGRIVRPFSNLRGEATVRPAERAWVDFDGFFNLYTSETVMIDTDLKTRPVPFVLLAAGQRYTRMGTVLPIGDALNPVSQTADVFWYTESSPLIRFYTGSARVDLPIGLRLAARVYFDDVEHEIAEADYGFQYDGGCWAAAASFIDRPDRNQVTFLLTLKAAGESESRAMLDLFKPIP